MIRKIAALVAVAGAFAGFGGRPFGDWTPGGSDSRVLLTHRAGVTGVQFAPDGEWIASASLDGTVRIAAASDGSLEHEWRHGAEVYAVAVSPEGDMVAWSGQDGRIVVAEPGSEEPLSDVKLPGWSVAITFAPDGTLLIAGVEGSVRWLDPLLGEVRRTVETGSELLAVAVSSDGTRVATAPPIKVWDSDTGTLVKSVPGHGQGGLAFSPDGSTLAVAGTHREIPLFDVAGGKVAQPARASLRGHAMTVTSVDFDPDGRRLASGSLDGTVRIWELE